MRSVRAIDIVIYPAAGQHTTKQRLSNPRNEAIMSGIVLLSVLGVVSAGFYVAYLKFSSYGSDDDDIERDGGDSTKIRHERGI